MSLFLRTCLFCASAAGAWAGILSITETNADPGSPAIIEPRESSNGSLFGEDAFAFVDRSHEYNGVAFDASGHLTTGSSTDPAISSFVGLPSYLLGNLYIAIANENKDNAGYTLTIQVDSPSYVYLLIDNRVGDDNNKDIPALGSGGVGVMPWVADMGFILMNTGLSPLGQSDFVGLDQGAQTIISPGDRTHLSPGLAIGAGNSVDQFFSVYRMSVASSITLGEQNDTRNRNIYGVVVAPTPEPATWIVVGLVIGAGLLRRKRSRGRQCCCNEA
ncbi:MAG TPA: PEP-CTERM sorting domain-containing protein [Bryobacteraceae bacterium]|jgi:hypothetical protein